MPPHRLNRRSLVEKSLKGAAALPFWGLGNRLCATDGVTDSEFILGVSAAFRGPSRSLGIELYRGSQAYFRHVNQSGGINGRTVRLQCYDDGYQPVPSVLNTLKLIAEDDVFALFGYVGTPTVTRVLPLLKKFQDRNAYIFFPFTGAQPQRQPPYGDFAFNLRASYAQETAGLVHNFVRVGRSRVAVFYQADAYGRSGWAGVRDALAEHDKTIVGEATYKRGTRFTDSMRRQVEILKETNPDSVICTGSYAACAAFIRDSIDFGLEVPIANLSFVGSENLLKLLVDSTDSPERYTRLLVNSQVVPSYEDLSIPVIPEYRSRMTTVNTDLPSDLLDEPYTPLLYSFVSLEGYLNAKLMTEILTRMGDQPARERLEGAVFSVKDFDLGINELVSFSPRRRQGLQRIYYTMVDDRKFVTLSDWSERFAK